MRDAIVSQETRSGVMDYLEAMQTRGSLLVETHSNYIVGRFSSSAARRLNSAALLLLAIARLIAFPLISLVSGDVRSRLPHTPTLERN